MSLISKSQALRMLRAQFGSLTRIREDEAELGAVDEQGELICAVPLEGEDPYRRLLAVACRLQKSPPPDARREARERNAAIIRANLLRGPPKGVIQ